MKEVLLLAPGPTIVPTAVLQAGAVPMILHRSIEFSQILRETMDGLQLMFGTACDVLIFPCSGRGAFEAAIVGCLSPGDRILVTVNGNFGRLLASMATKLGMGVVAVEPEWDRPASPEAIDEALRQDPSIKLVAVVHSETSTSVLNDIGAIASIARLHDRLVVVDAVSSLGAMPINMDAAGIDIVFSASQKGLMSPPGLGLLAVGPRAWAMAEKSTSPRAYFDLLAARELAHKSMPQTPGTTPVSLVQSLHKAVELIVAEGLENVHARHEFVAKLTRVGVSAMGLEIPPSTLCRRSSTVTPVRTPSGLDSGELLSSLASKYNLHLGRGLGQWARDTFRIGHMGVVDAGHIKTGLTMVAEELDRRQLLSVPVHAAEVAIDQYLAKNAERG